MSGPRVSRDLKAEADRRRRWTTGRDSCTSANCLTDGVGQKDRESHEWKCASKQ